MSSLPINPVDLIVIAVLLLSALLALFRGFVKEVLGIAGWVAAVAATIFFFPIVRDIVRSYIDSRLIADIVTGAAIFLPRSEEHTSELQSQMRISYAVFCLKKKNTGGILDHHISPWLLRMTHRRPAFS